MGVRQCFVYSINFNYAVHLSMLLRCMYYRVLLEHDISSSTMHIHTDEFQIVFDI